MQKLSSPIKLIKDSVAIFFDKKNLLNFIKIYSPLIPFSLFSLWQSGYIKSFDQIKDYRIIGLIVLVNLVYLIISFWVSVSGIMSIKKAVGYESFEFRSVYGDAWKILWGFSLISILVFLVSVGGTMLLIIPGIIFSTWFYFAKFIFVDQNLGVTASLKRSRGLVRGKFWPVLLRLFVFGLFTVFAGFVVSVLPYGIGGILTSLLGALFILPSYLLYKELSV